MHRASKIAAPSSIETPSLQRFSRDTLPPGSSISAIALRPAADHHLQLSPDVGGLGILCMMRLAQSTAFEQDLVLPSNDGYIHSCRTCFVNLRHGDGDGMSRQLTVPWSV